MTRTLLALLAVVTFAFAGCDGGDDGDDNGQPTAATPAGDATAPPDGTTPSAVEPTVGPPPDVEGEPTVTASGLQIIDIEVGGGDDVAAGATVTVHYTGWLEDGTVFDSSVARGEPATFSLAGVITGWEEGIPGMKEGGKRRLIVPPDLAYADQGSQDGSVPPGATLTFDVEVLDTQ